MKLSDKEKVYKDFIKETKIVLVDKNPSSRSRLYKILVDLGSKASQVYSVSSKQEAIDILSEQNVGMVISEYFIKGGSGFDLFKMLREKDTTSNGGKVCNILVTANISQSAVAKAAEEDVDTFIVKPYTIATIKETLVNSIYNIMCPSEYIQMIEGAKDQMVQGDFSSAVESLNQALLMHPRPSLAKFYLGQAEYMQNALKEAEDNYRDGLKLEGIHFKCLVGLYELLLEREKYDDAYSVVKKIAKVFPANPDRINQVIHLAIRTQNYMDMELYYEIYKNIDERNNLTTKHIGAGLFVAAKYLLKRKMKEKALVYFNNLAVSCSEFTHILSATVLELSKYNLNKEAATFLKRFEAGTLDSYEYIISKFVIDSSEAASNPGSLVTTGMDIMRKFNPTHIIFYQRLKKLMVDADLPARRIEEIDDCIQKYRKLSHASPTQKPTKQAAIS